MGMVYKINKKYLVALSFLTILLFPACDDKDDKAIQYKDVGTQKAPVQLGIASDTMNVESQVADISFYSFVSDSSGVYKISVAPKLLKFVVWMLYSDSDFSSGFLKECGDGDVYDPIQDCSWELAANTKYYLHIEYFGDFFDPEFEKPILDELGTIITISIIYEGSGSLI